MNTKIALSTVVGSALLLISTLTHGFQEIGYTKETLAPYQPRQLPIGTTLTRLNPHQEEYSVTVAFSDQYPLALVANDGCHYLYSEVPRATYVTRSCPDNRLNREREIIPKGKVPEKIVVGTRYRYLFRSDGYSAVARCVTKAKVKVRIALGEFDTYKLVCSSKDAIMTHYLSPELGTYAAYVTKRKGEPRQIFEHVAIDYPQ